MEKLFASCRLSLSDPFAHIVGKSTQCDPKYKHCVYDYDRLQ